MQTTQEVIYHAANLEQANLLKNLMREQGIEALVTNAMLQQAAGRLPFGGPIEPRLVVDVSDAPKARRIAIEFDKVVAQRQLSEDSGGDSILFRVCKWSVFAFFILVAGLGGISVIPLCTGFLVWTIYLFLRRGRSDGKLRGNVAAAEATETDAESETPAAVWPTCPDCSRRRHTSCPVCETAGTDFERAFMPAAPEGDAGPAGAPEKLLVLCPVCDEAFAPEFSARCEWCGHKFADGRELPPASRRLEVNARVWFVVAGLALVAAAVTAFFFYIARPR